MKRKATDRATVQLGDDLNVKLTLLDDGTLAVRLPGRWTATYMHAGPKGTRTTFKR